MSIKERKGKRERRGGEKREGQSALDGHCFLSSCRRLVPETPGILKSMDVQVSLLYFI
jgi:hypothetical protein